MIRGGSDLITTRTATHPAWPNDCPTWSGEQGRYLRKHAVSRLTALGDDWGTYECSGQRQFRLTNLVSETGPGRRSPLVRATAQSDRERRGAADLPRGATERVWPVRGLPTGCRRVSTTAPSGSSFRWRASSPANPGRPHDLSLSRRDRPDRGDLDLRPRRVALQAAQ